MNCHEYELELGDLVDDTLAPERVSAVEAHVSTCLRCRATVADFTAIRAATRTLEPQMPAARVWTSIAAALEQEQQRRAADATQALPTKWWRLTGGALAWKPLMAAAAMVVVLFGGTWLAWHDASTPAGRQATTTATTAGTPSTVEAEVQLAEQHYSTAIGDLEKVTQAESGSLDPDTAKVMQANLAVIDQAIGQSREALHSEPASTVAQESLFDALRSKVQLLQDTVALINEMRKGNQEGAARIMSGMNQ
jgi:anti-sigma factor RsiW